MTDKEGNKEDSVNYGSSVAAKDFTVDTTYFDIVKVEGIADKGVLGLVNGEIDADVKINITINDVLDKTYTYGKDFDDANTVDGGQFVLNDGGAKTQSFKIVVTDKAGNVIDTSNKDEYKPGYVFFDQLVVSQNAFVQFYANKVLFFGSIAGVALLAGFIIFIVVKKRKKDDEEENTKLQA